MYPSGDFVLEAKISRCSIHYTFFDAKNYPFTECGHKPEVIRHAVASHKPAGNGRLRMGLCRALWIGERRERSECASGSRKS